MMRTILGTLCAGTASLALAAAQTPQSQPQTAQSPPAQQTQQSQTQRRSVSLTGCVYQASDQPTLFALRGTGDQTQKTAQGNQPQGQTGQGQSAEGQTGAATGTTGTTGGTKGTEGAWYRLTPEGTQDLKQYTGQAVRVSGTLVPGKDPKGADVVIHRIEPQKTVVTAIDLQPAPQLRIQSISSLTGATCPTTPNEKR
jgi:hypothetical protein